MGNAKSKRKKDQVEAAEEDVPNGQEPSLQKSKSKKKNKSKKGKKKDKKEKNGSVADDMKLQAPTIVISPPSDIDEVFDSKKDDGESSPEVNDVSKDEPSVEAPVAIANGEDIKLIDEDEEEDTFLQDLPQDDGEEESLMHEILQKFDSIDNLSDSAIDIDSPRSVVEESSNNTFTVKVTPIAVEKPAQNEQQPEVVSVTDTCAVKVTPLVASSNAPEEIELQEPVPLEIIPEDRETPVEQQQEVPTTEETETPVVESTPVKEEEESVNVTPAEDITVSTKPDLLKDTPPVEPEPKVEEVVPEMDKVSEEISAQVTVEEPITVSSSTCEEETPPQVASEIATDSVTITSSAPAADVIVVTALPDVTSEDESYASSNRELDVIAEEPTMTDSTVVANGVHVEASPVVITNPLLQNDTVDSAAEPRSPPPVATKPQRSSLSSYKQISDAPSPLTNKLARLSAGSDTSDSSRGEPPMANTNNSNTANVVERMSFRDRRKYFEQEIKQQSLPRRNSEEKDSIKKKKISLISDQDLRTFKREEEKKFGTLTREEIRKSMDFDQDYPEEDEEEEMIEKIADVSPDTSNVVAAAPEPRSPPPVPEKKRLTARERLNPRYIASSMTSSVSSDDDAIRSLEEDVMNSTQNYDDPTAPTVEQSAVQRLSRGGPLDERLQVTSPDVKHDVSSETGLSPAERRAMEAEKRKQWRQARFKSLEADAYQAQMVMTKEMMLQRGRKTNENE